MREENRSEIIHDALNFLDDEMIEEVDRLRGGIVDVAPSTPIDNVNTTQESSIQREFRPWRKWAALAASVCVLIIVGTLWNGSMLKGTNDHADDMNLNQEENKQEGIDLELNSGYPEAEDYKYGVQDGEGDQIDQQKDYETNLGKPHEAESESDEELVKLQNYTAVYFSEVKNQNPSDDGMVQLSEEECEILVKFLDSMQRGTTCVVDAVSQSEMMNKADGQLVFELEDGTRFHLILIADGLVCSDETPNVWIQMDKRIYQILIESLKENS